MEEGVRVKCRVCKRADKNLRNFASSPLYGPLTVGNNAETRSLFQQLGEKVFSFIYFTPTIFDHSPFPEPPISLSLHFLTAC